MPSAAPAPSPTRPIETWLIVALFAVALGFNGWAVSAGWKHANLPGHEFRQAQTAVSAYFIQQEHNFSLAYPTPVLGKPWSVPFEFPLYQSIVAGIAAASGLDLDAVGRFVSMMFLIACGWPAFAIRRRLELPDSVPCE